MKARNITIRKFFKSKSTSYFTKTNMLDKLETELKIRGFSQKTLSAYIFHNQKFLDFIKKKPEDITEDDIWDIADSSAIVARGLNYYENEQIRSMDIKGKKIFAK